MYKFEMKLLYNEEELFSTKQELLNFKITLPLAKLDIVGSRLVSNGLMLIRSYSGRYLFSNF